MGQEVTDQDPVAEGGGQFGKPAADGGIQCQGSVSFQEEDSHCGELFGD